VSSSDLFLPFHFQSISDLTVLAAISALEATIAKAEDDLAAEGETYEGTLDVEFKYGRPDIDCGCEEDFLPPPITSDGSLYNYQVLDDVMGSTMGFTRQEIAAIMGAHTLGGMSKNFSGFPFSDTDETKEFSWVRNKDHFDNGKFCEERADDGVPIQQY
jgi:hypothetical protein